MIAQPNKAPNSAEDHDGRRMPPTISADPRGGRPSGIFIFCVANRESCCEEARRTAAGVAKLPFARLVLAPERGRRSYPLAGRR